MSPSSGPTTSPPLPSTAASGMDAALVAARVERDLYRHRPALRSAADAVVAAVHLGWGEAGAGLDFVGLREDAGETAGEEDEEAEAAVAGAEEEKGDGSGGKRAASGAAAGGGASKKKKGGGGPFPDGWNASEDVYTFVYERAGGGAAEGREKVVMKAVRMDDTVLFHVASKGGRVASLEVLLAQHTEPGKDPAEDPAAVFKRLDALVQLAASGLYEPVAEAAAAGGGAGTQQRRRPQDRRPAYEDDPLRAGPPRRPGFGPPGYGGGMPGRGGGDFDRDVGPSFPPGMGGGNPLVGGGGMGGMRVGPGHPMFGRPGGRGPRPPGGRGGGVPRPRYDPIGPFGGDGGPDNDELRPPGPPPPDMFM